MSATEGEAASERRVLLLADALEEAYRAGRARCSGEVSARNLLARLDALRDASPAVKVDETAVRAAISDELTSMGLALSMGPDSHAVRRMASAVVQALVAPKAGDPS